MKILFKNNKSLTITTGQRIYQRESNVDLLYFYIPEIWNDLSLVDFVVTLEYIDSGNIAHAEILEATESDKDGYLLYTLPVTSKFTYVAGDVVLKLSMSNYDQAEDKTYVLKSGELRLAILPLRDYFVYTSDESLSVLDNKILELKSVADELAATAELIPSTVPSDLELTDKLLQLTNSEGQTIGDGVELPVD